jgi:hypothetical protein
MHTTDPVRRKDRDSYLAMSCIDPESLRYYRYRILLELVAWQVRQAVVGKRPIRPSCPPCSFGTVCHNNHTTGSLSPQCKCMLPTGSWKCRPAFRPHHRAAERTASKLPLQRSLPNRTTALLGTSSSGSRNSHKPWSIHRHNPVCSRLLNNIESLSRDTHRHAKAAR